MKVDVAAWERIGTYVPILNVIFSKAPDYALARLS
jgi:hypothetical protein